MPEKGQRGVQREQKRRRREKEGKKRERREENREERRKEGKKEEEKKKKEADPVLIVFNVEVDVRVEEVLNVLFVAVRSSNESPQWQFVYFSRSNEQRVRKKEKGRKEKD